MFRFLFPSFEKPGDRPRYLNIEQESRNFHGAGIVLLLAAVCGAGFALWEPSHQITTPFASASSSTNSSSTNSPSANSPSANSPSTAVKATETTAAAPGVEDEPAPTVKLSTLCSQRATARRDCASAKAFKDARLNAPDPAPATVEETKPEPAGVKASDPAESADARSLSVTANETAAAPPSETPAAQTQKPATPKVKRPRPAEEAPVERLVKVYDQVMPDGRRVPVYRRVGTGALETGSIVDGEYRPAARRANLDPPSGYFGLQ